MTEEVSSMTSMFSRMITSRFTLGDTDSSKVLVKKEANGIPPTIPRDLELKIALVGGNGVGKSSIARRWLKRPYQSAYHQTVGVDVNMLEYPYDGSKIHVHIWDVSSAEVESNGLHELLCDELDGIFFVFNVHRVSSIMAVDAWRSKLAQFISSSEVPCYLLCHKADMLQKRVMTSDDIEAYVRTAGYRGWSWTVGRMGLGESERNPAVMEALDKMIGYICLEKPLKTLINERNGESTTPMLLKHNTESARYIESMTPCISSTSLHIPTKAITTIPRRTDMEDEGFGAQWIFGEQKGQYLVENDLNECQASPVNDTPVQEDIPESEIKVKDDGWRYFAGSIERTKAESLLRTRDEGAFLVRRKDSQTLVLSYKGQEDIHHVLLEYNEHKYHIGSAKSPNQPSFETLDQCLKSVQRYANKGIVFKRRRWFRVGAQTIVMQENVVEPTPRGATKSNFQVSDANTVWKISDDNAFTASRPRLQSVQEPVEVPPLQRLQVLSREFYNSLRQRLRAILSRSPNEMAVQIQELLSVADLEEREIQDKCKSANALEDMWRKLVKDMECWNQILATLVLICIYNMHLLLYCKQQLSPNRGMSFGDVGLHLLGKRGKMAVNVFLVGTQLSFCCVYFTVVATNLHAVLPTRIREIFQERQLILMIFPIILGLSWVRTLHKITPFSALATFAVFLGIAIVFYYSYVYGSSTSSSPIYKNDLSWSQFAEFYGTAVYSFEGIGLILPLEKDMEEPKYFGRLLMITMSFILVLFILLGELPVLAFGTIKSGSMTAVLQDYFSSYIVSLANILLAIACLFSFPIQFYPALEVLEKQLTRHGYFTPAIQDYNHIVRVPMVKSTNPLTPSPPVPYWIESLLNTTQYELRRTFFRSMLVTCLMLVAICIPNVGLLISLFGSVGSSMLAVILPPIFYLSLNNYHISTASFIFHGLLIVLGIIGMIAGTIQALIDIANSFN
ncbi:hypothetical protein THRCLA_07986 [Thraustotheca clavata]|uniref:SH2 domain-containing protein n=1 Tax=Thraustotheca clavata TaxID=74557 RepID=A0A1V9ZBB6_9STRA|nr:hypothetical protein THRCLA_07986 [Thraustotheca clavata]